MADKNTLLALNATNIPDNNNKEASPADVREVNEQVIGSNANLDELTTQTFLGPVVFDGGIAGVSPLNEVIINSLEDLEKLIIMPSTVITYVADTLYRFGAKVTHAYEAEFEDGAVLLGPSNFTDIYEYTGTGVAFTSPSGVQFKLENFGFSVPNGTVFNVTNPPTMILNFVRCFTCDKVGSVTGDGSSAFNIFDTVFLDIKSQGLEISGGFIIMSIREALLLTTDTGVNLLDWRGALFDNMEITNLEAIAPVGSFVLVGDAGSVNMAAGRVASIKDSNLSDASIGNSLGGGLLADDSGYSYKDATVIDSAVIGHCYVVTVVTTPISSGVEVPISGVFQQGVEASQTASSAAGFITTLNRIEKRGNISVDIDVDKNGGGQDDYVFRAKKIPIATGIAENVDGVSITRTIAGGGTDAFALSGPIRHVEGDQFYISVEGQSNDDIDVITQGFKVSD